MQIIPAIDIRGGKTVRLLHGDYSKQTSYDVEPAELARHYASLELKKLHVVDLDGALDGVPRNADVLKRVIEATGAEVQVGGGLRELSHVEALFDAGVTRIVIGSLAVTQPSLVAGWFEKFGTDRIVLAIDVRISDEGDANVATHGWTETHAMTLQRLIEKYLPVGLKHVLCTDISRDGAMTGPSVALYQELVQDYPMLAVQASGGVSDLDDLVALRSTGVSGAITGRALLEGKITDQEIRSF
ncbi:MAG: 1-(5-phosphoribosyl)-5-[(5-phosphoribosylamino)methylideneamino]imidazole-4-carboxamide isomerase [Pseudomonadota bacterium]